MEVLSQKELNKINKKMGLYFPENKCDVCKIVKKLKAENKKLQTLLKILKAELAHEKTKDSKLRFKQR